MAAAGGPASWENKNENAEHEGLIMSQTAERLGRGMRWGYARGIPVHADRFGCRPAVKDESDERYA
jgi:hypothetical protein